MFSKRAIERFEAPVYEDLARRFHKASARSAAPRHNRGHLLPAFAAGPNVEGILVEIHPEPPKSSLAPKGLEPKLEPLPPQNTMNRREQCGFCDSETLMQARRFLAAKLAVIRVLMVSPPGNSAGRGLR
jgi:hypothetical protein